MAAAVPSSPGPPSSNSGLQSSLPDDPATQDAPLGLDAGALGNIRLGLDGMVESQRRLNIELAGSTRLGQQFGRSLSSAFVGLTLQGKGFGEVLGSLALSLSRLALGAAFKPLETALGTALQSLLAAPAPFSGSSIAAPAAFPLSAGLPVAGGVGAASPTSVSSADLRSQSHPTAAGPTVVLHVTTPDAESFRRSETQISALLARAVGQGQRNL